MKSFANAMGGTTARACDSCVKRRARWYCAADEAFLCQSCDTSVHSANPLARRHERVRLKTASFSGGKNHSAAATKTARSSSSPPRSSAAAAAATWHNGFTRKARTPRGGSNKKSRHLPVLHDLVPEISVDDQTTENYEEEHLIYRVPVLDPIGSERYKNDAVETKPEFLIWERVKNNKSSDDENDDNAESCLNGFFPTDIQLEEFAADVETLLGHGLETETFAMEELGLADGSSLGNNRGSSTIRLKVEQDDVARNGEQEEEEKENSLIKSEGSGANEETFELSFDYESGKAYGENSSDDGEKVKVVNVKEEDDAKDQIGNGDNCVIKERKRKFPMLSLDYEAVISTWGAQGPPWADGEPPEIDPDDDRWPIDDNGAEVGHQSRYVHGYCGGRLNAAFGNGNSSGREARVSRYREKRRTRLFSKKIRYEVRKLNAEKRPRMKGRFVKRASLAAASSSFPTMIATK